MTTEWELKDRLYLKEDEASCWMFNIVQRPLVVFKFKYTLISSPLRSDMTEWHAVRENESLNARPATRDFYELGAQFISRGWGRGR